MLMEKMEKILRTKFTYPLHISTKFHCTQLSCLRYLVCKIDILAESDARRKSQACWSLPPQWSVCSASFMAVSHLGVDTSVYKWKFWPDRVARRKLRGSENICIHLLEIINMDKHHEYWSHIKYSKYFFKWTFAHLGKSQRVTTVLQLFMAISNFFSVASSSLTAALWKWWGICSVCSWASTFCRREALYSVISLQCVRITV